VLLVTVRRFPVHRLWACVWRRSEGRRCRLRLARLQVELAGVQAWCRPHLAAAAAWASNGRHWPAGWRLRRNSRLIVEADLATASNFFLLRHRYPLQLMFPEPGGNHSSPDLPYRQSHFTPGNGALTPMLVLSPLTEPEPEGEAD